MATILVVDDRALNRSMLNTLLGYRGHRIVEACDGVEALNKAQAEIPELIITDILMPNMDGYELVQRLREDDALRNIKVVFYSSLYREHEARTLAAACGVSQIICKPTDPQEILRVVDDVLSSEQRDRVNPLKPETKTDIVNLLSSKLYQKVVELEELTAALEERVALRTKELQEINRRLQEQIVQREKAEEAAASDRENKLKVKGDFLSHVSHELRSPLTVVHQFVSILLDGLGGSINANQKEYLEIAQRNVKQLKSMIDDLLEASRAETCKLTVKRLVISVSDVLQQTIESFRTTAAKGISLQTYIPEDLPPVYADPGRICQVLTNLLDNAVKFSPTKVSITVRAQILEEDPNSVCISVADCGCGVEPEESERIFDRLYQVQNSLQAARRGLGLGLYICKELISLHGGRIWNDSKRLGGCTISFTLPVFSIGSMIAPIVKKGALSDSSFALITIEVLPVNAWPSERKREQALAKIYQVVDRCILPDLDVLLPPQNRAGEDLFWIVARTNQIGTDVVVKRVREQLSDCQDLKLAGVSCSLSSVVLNPGPIESEWPLERQVQCVVSCLEKLLQIETAERNSLV